MADEEQKQNIAFEGTTEEMLDSIGQEIMANSYAFIKRLQSGEKITDDEKALQDDLQDQFKILNQTYCQLKKANRIGSTGSKAFDEKLHEKLLDKIKNKPNSVANIVTKIPDSTNGLQD